MESAANRADVRPADKLTTIASSVGMNLTDRSFADFMDNRDPLRDFRRRFAYPKRKTLPGVDSTLCDPEEDCVYMCGNSLGLMPLNAPVYIKRVLEIWSDMGVHGHETGDFLPWAHCDEYVIEASARLVGADPDEVSIQSGLSVNLHLLFAAFYRPTKERHKILMESKAFPSDHYLVSSQATLHGYDPESSVLCVEPRKGSEYLDLEDILDTIDKRGHEIAIILFSGVQYYTGQLFDMERITAAGHQKGCIVGFDLAHAVGNVKLQLHDWNVDFAAWCSYKYLNSGAGGIAGLFFHKSWHDNVLQLNGERKPLNRMEGWWSHQHSTRFRMNNERDLSPGAAGFRVNNPPPLLVAPLLASLEIFDDATMDDIAQKQFLLTGYLEYLFDVHLRRRPESTTRATIFTPADPRQRGSQLSLTFSAPVRAVNVELEKRGIVCDIREPCVLRVAPAPLYNSYRDVYLFVETLRKVLDSTSVAH